MLDVGAGCRQALPAQRASVANGLCQGLNLEHTKICICSDKARSHKRHTQIRPQ